MCPTANIGVAPWGLKLVVCVVAILGCVCGGGSVCCCLVWLVFGLACGRRRSVFV